MFVVELVSDRVGVAQTHRRFDVENLGVGQAQLLFQEIVAFVADGVGQFQAEGCQALAALEHIAHHGPEIVVDFEIFVVGVDVGVARDRHLDLFDDGVGVEDDIRVIADHVFGGDVAQCVAGRQVDHVRQAVGNWDNREDLTFRLILQDDADFDFFVLQVRERMVGVDDQRREQRQDMVLEMLFDVFLFVVGEFVVRQMPDILMTQLVFEVEVNPILFGAEGSGRAVNVLELFVSGPTGFAVVVGVAGRHHIDQ